MKQNSTQHNINQALQELSLFLSQNLCESPRLVAQLLITHILQVDKIYLITNHDKHITVKQWQDILSLAIRHAKGEPLAYILGVKEFYGRDFKVTKDTLIPRPESEDVLDALISKVKTKSQHTYNNISTFADIGTGSGCLACTFASEVPNIQGYMLDISPKALDIAICNAEKIGVRRRVQPILSTLYALPFAEKSLDIIISNPPYISEEEFINLDTNVRDFEPKTALIPIHQYNTPNNIIDNGLAHIEAIARQAYKILKNNGLCIVEHGYTQGKAVRELFLKYAPWEKVTTGQDLAGLDRYCLCEK